VIDAVAIWFRAVRSLPWREYCVATAASLVAALVAALVLIHQPIALVGVVVGIPVLYMTLRSPRFAFCLWFAGLCFIPYWLIVHIGVSWPPGSILGLLVLPSALTHRPRRGITTGDWVALAFACACTSAYLFGGAPRSLLAQVFVQGGIAYLVGRNLAPAAGRQWTINTISIVLTLIGVWAIGEYIFSFHPFTRLDLGSPQGYWAALQTRGGHIRSEAAFGQAISLGAALAVGVPFVYMSTFRNSRKAFAWAILGCGLLTTASRGPLVAAALGLVLVIVFGEGRAVRGTRLVFSYLGLLIAVPVAYLLTARLNEAGAEVALSANYRGTLYHLALEDMHVNSLADNLRFTEAGHQIYHEALASIDSTFLQTALVFGWLPVAIVLGGFAIIIVRILVRKANVSEIALVAQLPVLATVALITQYYYMVWFVAGFAVALTMEKHAVVVRSHAVPESSIPRLERRDAIQGLVKLT
jgi:hypothetical protein